jgi:hypothetical protein
MWLSLALSKGRQPGVNLRCNNAEVYSEETDVVSHFLFHAFKFLSFEYSLKSLPQLLPAPITLFMLEVDYHALKHLRIKMSSSSNPFPVLCSLFPRDFNCSVTISRIVTSQQHMKKTPWKPIAVNYQNSLCSVGRRNGLLETYSGSLVITR